MLKGLDPLQDEACMTCQKASARYYGGWGPVGICRACILGSPSDLRLKLLREMHPADRQRWRLDEAWEHEHDGQPLARGTVFPSRPGSVALEPKPSNPGTMLKRDLQRGATGHLQPERRRHPRCPVRLPTSVTYSGSVGSSSQSRPHVHYSMSKDLSIGGIRVSIQNPNLLDLARDTLVQVEFLLSRPSVMIRCGATVRAMVAERRGAELGYLCLAFDRLGQGQERTLEDFTRERFPGWAGNRS